MNWFLYDNGLRHERVKLINLKMVVFSYFPQSWISQLHFYISYGKERSRESDTVFSISLQGLLEVN